jgi:hypothetical protein
MSSPGSVVTLELPRWPLADLLSLGLVVAAAVVVEAVAARHPGVPAGLGVAAAVLLVLWLQFQRRRRPRTVVLTPGAGHLRLPDGRQLPCRPGTGSRLLGTSIVLHWRSPGGSGSLWLTAADISRERLRALAVCLAAAGRPAAQ